jgi:predicted permease
VLGYMAKRIFKDDMSTKTLTLMSVYFLQPFVTIWGFSTAKLHAEHIYVPLLYLAIILALLIPTILLGKLIFTDTKERAIFSIAGFVGNTGNIGIPLGIALFGEQSVIYTTLINIANVFVVYIIGVYIYSRGSFSIKDSLFNIVKIPIIPASVVAILINIYDIPLSRQIEEFFKMGAYAGIVLQLFLLGTFLQGIRIKEVHPKLMIGTLSQKFVIIPLATAFILSFTDLSLFVQGVIFMEMVVPLAIANINLASLYDCKPKDVTSLILLSTLIFIPLLFGLSYIVNHTYLG